MPPYGGNPTCSNPFYAWVFQVVSFLRGFLPKPCIRFSSPPYALHAPTILHKIIQTKEPDRDFPVAYINLSEATEWKPHSLILSRLSVRLSLYLISHHAMKEYEGLEM
jgi:hypothetical protein